MGAIRPGFLTTKRLLISSGQAHFFAFSAIGRLSGFTELPDPDASCSPDVSSARLARSDFELPLNIQIIKVASVETSAEPSGRGGLLSALYTTTLLFAKLKKPHFFVPDVPAVPRCRAKEIKNSTAVDEAPFSLDKNETPEFK